MRRIINVKLPEGSRNSSLNSLWWIGLNSENKIIQIQPMSNEEHEIEGENWEKDFLSPMGIDLQINGGMGISFNQLTEKQLPNLLKLLDKLWQDGIEFICPTLITCETNQLRTSLAILQKAREQHSPNRCKLLGAHLEGPFISKRRIGAHPERDISSPNLQELEKRIQGFEKEIQMMTLAPELPGAKDVIKQLHSKRIISCLGHSEANKTDAEIAFNNGITMITHTFNAMKGLHHREPGPIGAAIEHGNIALGLIADGVHINPLVASMLHKLAPRKLVLVSDALPAYGLENANYFWGEKELIIREGTCFIKNGPLAGTTLSLLEGCKNLANWIHNPSAAIWSATIAPREVIWGEMSISKLLIGQSLSRLLRWQQKNTNCALNWQQAA